MKRFNRIANAMDCITLIRTFLFAAFLVSGLSLMRGWLPIPTSFAELVIVVVFLATEIVNAKRTGVKASQRKMKMPINRITWRSCCYLVLGVIILVISWWAKSVYDVASPRIQEGQLTWLEVMRTVTRRDGSAHINVVPHIQWANLTGETSQLDRLEAIAEPIIIKSDSVAENWKDVMLKGCGQSYFSVMPPGDLAFFEALPDSWRFLASIVLRGLGIASSYDEWLDHGSRQTSLKQFLADCARSEKPYSAQMSPLYLWFVKPFVFRPVALFFEKLTYGKYLYDTNFKELCPDLNASFLFPPDSRFLNDARVYFVGMNIGAHQLSGFPLHLDFHDSHSIIMQLVGRKHFWIFDADDYDLLDPYTFNTILFGASVLGEGRGEPAYKWMQWPNSLSNAIHAPLFSLARGWYGTLEPGDMVYFPPGNPHFFLADGDPITASVYLRWDQ